MATTITADEYLASLTKWTVDWEFYRDKADFLSRNRNEQQGFGPIRGVVGHNTASTAQRSMIDYLAHGDPGRNLGPPLVQTGILKTGKVVLIGWGSANHSGPGDPTAEALARANALPLDREVTPKTVGTDAGTVAINRYYLAFEMCHGAEGPTIIQYRQAVLYTCACLDVCGGPDEGYGAGSFLMHRELTKNRSDPQGVAPAQFRRDVAARLKAGPPGPIVITPPPPVIAPEPAAPEDDMFSDADRELLKLIKNTLTKADGATLRNDLKWQNEQAAKFAGQLAGLTAAIQSLAGGQDVDLEAVTAAAKAGAQAALDEKIAGATTTLAVSPPE